MTDLLRSTLAYKQEHPTPPPPEAFRAVNMIHNRMTEHRSDQSTTVPAVGYDIADGSVASESGIRSMHSASDVHASEIKLRDLSVSKEEDHINEDEFYRQEPVAQTDPSIASRASTTAATGVDEDENNIMPLEDENMEEATDPQDEQLQVEVRDGGAEILGSGMRKMVDLVNRLRASGIEDLGLPLPRIAVVGNQSAGKSSLIEAISGIKVPRYTGTCTRCPLEINLQESSDRRDTWRCRISLRFKKRYDSTLAQEQQQHLSERHSNNGPRRSSSNRTYGSPWVDQPTEQVEFLVITDKNQVETVLVAAQRAVLNPSRNWRDYVPEVRSGPPRSAGGRPTWSEKRLPGGGSWSGFGRPSTGSGKNIEEDFEIKFSPNVVCMEITGPDLPNLAFIDLPGVIQTTESESEHYLIELVTRLVKEYVQEEDCLIMLAVTMKDDAVNQSAARLARELGEERTIGALTKPDTVGPGEYDQWINILRGNSHRLKHGYFVTKQPNQEQLVQGIDHAQARAQEAEFFENSEPWKTELSDLKHRFGTQALQSYLAKELGALIKKRLPGVIDSIRKQDIEVKNELATLPAPPTNNQTFVVHELISRFDSLLGGCLMGGPGHNEFQKELRKVAENFQKSLQSVRPALKLFPTAEEEKDFAVMLESPRPKAAAGRINKRNGEGEWFGDRRREASPTLRKGRKNQQGIEIHTLSSDEENGPSLQARKRRGGNEPANQTPKKPKRMLETTIGDSHKFNLPQIRHIIDSTSTARIPGQVDPTAVTSLIKKTINLWNPIIAEFLNQCGMLLNTQVHSCFVRIFEEYGKSPIFQAVYCILQRLVTEIFAHQKQVLDRIWELEKEQIFTLNFEDYNRYIENHSRILLDRRARNLEDQKGRAQLAAVQAADENNVTPRKKKAAPPPPVLDTQADPYRKEIEVLAQVRAYNEIAQKRFLDNVYMSIQAEMVGTFRKSILGELHTGLELNRPDVAQICTELLIEDPQKEKRRKELLGRRELLTRAMQQLSELEE